MKAQAQVLPLTEPAPPWAAARAVLLEQLASVCADAGMEHMTDYEDADASELEGLLARCDELVASAIEAFEVVALLYGEDAPCDLRPSDPGGTVDGDSETWFNCDGVLDTTVVARMGLRMRHREVRNLPKNAPRVDLLAAVGGTLRAIQRSVAAIDTSIAEAENIGPSITFGRESLERALTTRKLYVGLHRIVHQTGLPTPESLRLRLRMAQSAILQLLSLEISEHLRTSDRAMLRVMDGRLREWLQRNKLSETSAGSGMRLWQDLAAVVTLFLDVNKRQELVRHDGELAVSVWRDLPTSPSAWTVRTASEMRERLAPMESRCAVLDKFIRGGTLFELDQLRAALTNVIQVLRPEQALSPSTHEGPQSGRRPVGQEWI